MDENEKPNNDKPSDQPHKQPITKLKIGKAAAMRNQIMINRVTNRINNQLPNLK